MHCSLEEYYSSINWYITILMSFRSFSLFVLTDNFDILSMGHGTNVNEQGKGILIEAI